MTQVGFSEASDHGFRHGVGVSRRNEDPGDTRNDVVRLLAGCVGDHGNPEPQELQQLDRTLGAIGEVVVGESNGDVCK
ncbi:MAG: hypothetical protein EB145_12780 [Proteobacteria bacterium]|nr:hypothetical protein [Pseudomonadota bacterium]